MSLSSLLTSSAISLLLSLSFTTDGFARPAEPITVKETEAAIVLSLGKVPVLTYHKAEVAPPQGTDPAFRRSGFIHPLHAPGGGMVTGIHPKDHYHHLGLWHAWVHTEYDGQTPNFWDLKGKTGRVRFAGATEIRDGGFTAAQEQVAYLDGPDAEPTVILKESLAIDAAFVDGANVIDYVITQTNVTKKPLALPAYRYGGGVAFRGPHGWNKDNSDYLTSEGLDRTNSHATRARWVAMFGPAEGAEGKEATVAILCHPKNHDAPQRIRTWDNGKVFLNYVPTQESDWEIGPGKTVILRYRLVIFDGKPGAEAIDGRWRAYAKATR